MKNQCKNSCSDSESMILNKNVTWLTALATAKSPFLFTANKFSIYVFTCLNVYCRHVSTAAKIIKSTDTTLNSIINSVSIMVELPFNVSKFEIFSHLTFSVEQAFSNYGVCITTGTPNTAYMYVALI
jgi:hypothetical protein